MSFGLKFTERGLHDLHKLEFWLQEETLDELDRIAASPPAPSRHLAGAAVHDFIRERVDKSYYVFVTVIPDDGAAELRVMEIGLHVRPCK